MIKMTLTDDTISVELQALEIPLSEEYAYLDTEVLTLDNNVSVYILPGTEKRVWTHTWAYMDKDMFDILRGFVDRQRTLYKYPLVTIDEQDVLEVPVYMKLSAKNIRNHCGDVEDVTIELRESDQQIDWSS
jgi:hypothetical protein